MASQNKAVFWDFDGTLVIDSKWSGGLLQALDALHPGHSQTHETLKANFSRRFPWHFAEKYHPELSSPEAWWNLVRPLLAEAVEKAGYNPKESLLMAEMAHQSILRPDNYRLYDDTLPVLENLKSKGWRHYIVSNNFPELADIVRRMPFGNLFNGCISSGEVGYDKPNPGIFRYARYLAGNPEKVWMVGDNITADVRGAESAGIPAILVREPAKEPVAYHAPALEEAAEIIENNS